MRYFKWVSAIQLDRWADTNDAKSRLPELLRRLVHGTLEPSDLEHVDFPSGEETHRPGYDGVTKAKHGNAKVPEGITYWEIGADAGVKKKLDGDYEKRAEERGDGDFTKVSYIAVTPRDYQKKKEWSEDKNALKQWKEVRVYDSDDLEQWLEMAPGVALWLARYVSTSPEGLVDLSTHWENLQASLKKALPAAALLVNRQTAIEGFKQWLNGSPSVLTVACQSPREVVDVFAAWVSSLPEAEQAPVASRGIIVERADVWRDLAQSEQRLILICAEQLDIDEAAIAEACRKGHHVLLPASSIQTQGGGVLRLERLDRYELEKVLRAAGLSEQESFSLAQKSGGSFSVLKRQFSSLPIISKPKWGQGQEAGELAPLLLCGAWQDTCAADQDIVGKIAGGAYAEARKIVSRWHSEPDAPVRWVNGVWEFLSPLDAWSFLHIAVSPNQLDAVEKAACEVLGVDDPRLELPPDERWLANIHGKKLDHSDPLRRSLAQTLALLATRSNANEVTDLVSLQTRVNRVVGAILPEGASWKRWASLGTLLPLIAEAAPETFLGAVESGLQGAQPELARLFNEERGGITGRAEHTGLLWALERLAWSPELLPRVSIVLAKLDEHDPGGRWLNRPNASLRDIFFSWMPHTAANLEQRLDVLKLLLERHPNSGWNLIIGLLPSATDTIMEHHTPEWRFWAEQWKRGITHAEYWSTVDALTGLVLSTAERSPERWIELLPLISNFPEEYLTRAVDALEQAAHGKLSEDLRQKLWTVLREETQRHRYFSDAGWAFPVEVTTRLEGLRDELQPKDAVELAVPVFHAGFDMTGHKSLSWEEQEKLRQQHRLEAVRGVLASSGFDGILRLARSAKQPYAVGAVLAEATGSEHESRILPSLLCSNEKPIEQFAGNFAAYRIYQAGRDWAERLPVVNWRMEEAAALATQMPFDCRTWDFVRGLGEPVEKEYWRRTRNYRSGLSADEVEQAARKLMAAGRPLSAIELLAMTADQPGRVKPILQLELLETAMGVRPEEGKSPLGAHYIETLLKQLQAAPDVDETRLARLEWQFLPILGPHTLQPETLHKLLARDPSFFVELLTLIYAPHRRSDEGEPRGDDTKPDEFKRSQAQRAWRLLHEWQRVPGPKDDGTVDNAQLREWNHPVPEKAAAAERLEVCDVTVGGVFAHASGEPDGSWPCIPVRAILEEIESPKLENGFAIGIYNKRGVTSRSRREGGRQERELADKYETYAKACRSQYPRTSAILMRVRDGYLDDAKREDAEAKAED